MAGFIFSWFLIGLLISSGYFRSLYTNWIFSDILINTVYLWKLFSIFLSCYDSIMIFSIFMCNFCNHLCIHFILKAMINWVILLISRNHMKLNSIRRDWKRLMLYWRSFLNMEVIVLYMTSIQVSFLFWKWKSYQFENSFCCQNIFLFIFSLFIVI